MKARLPRFRPRKQPVQLTLNFDVEQTRPDYWTNTIGDFFEEATERLVDGRRFHTDSSCDYCPDVLSREGTYIESKASGRGGRVILYENRIKQEAQWAQENWAEIDYVIWRHKLYTKTCSTKEEIVRSLARSTYQAVRIPMVALHDLANSIKPRVINTKGRNGYRTGWLISVPQIIKAHQADSRRAKFKVAGRFINIEIISLTRTTT